MIKITEPMGQLSLKNWVNLTRLYRQSLARATEIFRGSLPGKPNKNVLQ